MTDQIGVIGAGAWGTTLAVKLAAAERPVTLWAHTPEANEQLTTVRENRRYLPGIVFPPNVRVATDEGYLAEPHRFFVLAVPSAHLRSTLRRLADRLYPDAALLSVVKGIEEGTHLRRSCPGVGSPSSPDRTWPGRSRTASRPVPWSPRRRPIWLPSSHRSWRRIASGSTPIRTWSAWSCAAR